MFVGILHYCVFSSGNRVSLSIKEYCVAAFPSAPVNRPLFAVIAFAFFRSFSIILRHTSLAILRIYKAVYVAVNGVMS